MPPMLTGPFFSSGSDGTDTVTRVMTIATRTLYFTKGPDPVGRGVDNGSDYYSVTPSNWGSLDSYDLHGLTISAIYWSSFNAMYLSIAGGSIPDTDESWIDMTINGTVFLRSSRLAYVASRDGGSHWWIPHTGAPYGTSGNEDVIFTWAL